MTTRIIINDASGMRIEDPTMSELEDALSLVRGCKDDGTTCIATDIADGIIIEVTRGDQRATVAEAIAVACHRAACKY